MFLVKITNKGTSLNQLYQAQMLMLTPLRLCNSLQSLKLQFNYIDPRSSMREGSKVHFACAP